MRDWKWKKGEEGEEGEGEGGRKAGGSGNPPAMAAAPPH